MDKDNLIRPVVAAVNKAICIFIFNTHIDNPTMLCDVSSGLTSIFVPLIKTQQHLFYIQTWTKWIK